MNHRTVEAVAHRLAETGYLDGAGIETILIKYPICPTPAPRWKLLTKKAGLALPPFKDAYMLQITVALVPGGFEPLRRTLATMTISNLSNLADRSDYRVEATEKENKLAGLPARSMRAEVTDHDRRQSVWILIMKAASAIADADEPVRDS